MDEITENLHVLCDDFGIYDQALKGWSLFLQFQSSQLFNFAPLALGHYEIRERTSVIQLFRIDTLPTRLIKIFNKTKGSP